MHEASFFNLIGWLVGTILLSMAFGPLIGIGIGGLVASQINLG